MSRCGLFRSVCKRIMSSFFHTSGLLSCSRHRLLIYFHLPHHITAPGAQRLQQVIQSGQRRPRLLISGNPVWCLIHIVRASWRLMPSGSEWAQPFWAFFHKTRSPVNEMPGSSCHSPSISRSGVCARSELITPLTVKGRVSHRSISLWVGCVRRLMQRSPRAASFSFFFLFSPVVMSSPETSWTQGSFTEDCSEHRGRAPNKPCPWQPCESPACCCLQPESEAACAHHEHVRSGKQHLISVAFETHVFVDMLNDICSRSKIL